MTQPKSDPISVSPSRDHSEVLFAAARAAMPGGVSSPVRAFGAVGGTPRFIERGIGGRIVDVDDNSYVDFVQSWGPLILGHAHPKVVQVVQDAAQRGLTYGAPHQSETKLAQHIAGCYPGVERVRFTSSGTEATMSAIRLARGVTERSRVVKFSGCYHGHADGLLVAAGSGAITFGEPTSAGVPAEIARLTSVVPLDDEAALDSLFAEHGGEIAAVIVEPMPANNGLLLQRPEWLEHLRKITAAHGALLIFDEVISGFRVARGGAAQIYGIEPDLVTFGKVVGGGLPCGAFAGSGAVLDQLAPLGPIYHAGTLSGNPLAMAAGLATLRELEPGGVFADDSVWAGLDSRTARFVAPIEAAIGDHGWPACVVRQGSVFWFALDVATAPRSAEAIPDSAAGKFATIHAECLNRGVYLAPSAYEVGFLSTAHTDADLTRAADVIVDAMGVAFS